MTAQALLKSRKRANQAGTDITSACEMQQKTIAGGAGSARHILALILFGAVSFVYFALPVLKDFAGSYIGKGNDPLTFVWLLFWWPHAIGHGMNPFITNQVWAPDGFNLAWSVPIPGLALLAAPITMLIGPIASYNILSLIAPTVGAWTAYLLCWHITRKFWPSIIGGYLYGFSSYELGRMMGHLNLAMIFLPPLAALFFLLRRKARIGRGAFIAYLTIILVLQFSISTEIFATATFFAATALAIAMATSWRKDRRRDIGIIVDMAVSYFLAAVILIPYLYYVFAERIPGIANSPFDYSAELLNYFIPTPAINIGGSLFAPVTALFPGDISEKGAYLGLPLLAIVYSFARAYWSRPDGKVLVIFSAVASIASLGPALHFLGLFGPSYVHLPLHVEGLRSHRLPFLLPWVIFSYLPFLGLALPTRFTLYVWMAVAMMVAMWLSDDRERSWIRSSLALLAVAFLLPSLGAPFWHSKLDIPPFFASNLYKNYLTRGENVVILPYGMDGPSMLWQVEAGMYFRMAGGYVGITPSTFGALPIVQTFYASSAGSWKSLPGYEKQLMQFIFEHDVGAIIVKDSVMRVFEPHFAAMGISPQRVGGVWIYQIPRSLRSAWTQAPASRAIGDHGGSSSR